MLPGELSDLFFNHRNDNYDAVFKELQNKNSMASPEEIEAAVLKDAQEFAAAYPQTCGDVTAEQLRDDFLHRL
jgi:hypothetical protein